MPPVLVKAPAGEAVKPVPFKVNGLALESVKPFRSKTAPELTVVAEEVPNAAVFPKSKVPAVIAVAPVYVLVPDNVQVPEPFLVSFPNFTVNQDL